MASTNLNINEDIKAPKIRLIGADGEQVGIVSLQEGITAAKEASLDLVEIVPNSEPPVCKILNYGKFRYDQTRRERENKKTQHHVKIKEVKFRPNIDEHDFNFKMRHVREFIGKGNKVRVVCIFRRRELRHTAGGERILRRVCEALEDIATIETPPKLMGYALAAVLAPMTKQKKKTAPVETSV